jgi:hypothetical protein
MGFGASPLKNIVAGLLKHLTHTHRLFCMAKPALGNYYCNGSFCFEARGSWCVFAAN